MALLKGSERAVADVSIERPADPNFKPTPQHVQRMNSAARGGSPFSLFVAIPVICRDKAGFSAKWLVFRAPDPAARAAEWNPPTC